MFRSVAPLPFATACAVSVLLCAQSGNASPVPAAEQLDRTENKPARLQGVDVTEQLGAALPKDLPFTSAEGQAVRLGDFLSGDHPVLITFNYSKCPMLCSLELNGLVAGLAQIDREIGRDFQMITISLDGKEDPQRFSAMKDRYVSQYLSARTTVAHAQSVRQGWHFLRGDDAAINAVTSVAGYRFSYNEARGEYLHPAAVALITPSGKIARYLYGIEYQPRTLSLSLVEVSEGKIGGSMDKLLLYCFHYDETEGRYAPVAMNIMRVGGGVTAIALGGTLAGFWLRESRKAKTQTEAERLS
jgi:protein SCO1/2